MSIVFIEGFDFYGDGLNTNLETSLFVRREWWRSATDVKDGLLFEARNGGYAVSIESVNEDNQITEPRLIGVYGQNFPETNNIIVQCAFKFTGAVDQGGNIGGDRFYGFPLIQVCGTDRLTVPSYIVDIYRRFGSPDIDADIRLLNNNYVEQAAPVGNLDPNIWHYIELHLDRTASPSVRARVYINGGIVIDETLTEGAGIQVPYGMIQLGARKINGPRCDPVYIDDLMVMDLEDASQGPLYQSRLGPISVRPMPVVADGIYNEWVGKSGGSRYPEVDEQPGESDLDATYVSANEAPRRQTFKVSMPHDIGTQIVAVTSFAVNKQPDPTKGLGRLSFLHREGSTDQVDTWVEPLQQVWRMGSQNYVALAEGGGLTPAEIQAAEWGIRSETGE